MWTSNSLLVGFIETFSVIGIRATRRFSKRTCPKRSMPQVVDSGEYFDDMHRAFAYFFPKVQNGPRKFLEWDTARIQKELQHLKDLKPRDRERTMLMIRLYQLLYKKYYPEYVDLLKDLKAVRDLPEADIKALKRALKRKNYYGSIVIILKFLSILKGRILSPKPTQSIENIYFKRHIAAGIPSMYGTYYEEKFARLRPDFAPGKPRQYALRGTDRFVQSQIHHQTDHCQDSFLSLAFNQGPGTGGHFHRGVWSPRVKYVTCALPIKQFSIDQYIDIFRFISKGIQDIIRDYYIDAHSANLPVIIAQVYGLESAVDPMAGHTKNGEAVYQHSENFIRGMISASFGLQVLDNFVNSVIDTLNAEMEKFNDNKQILNLVMAYNPGSGHFHAVQEKQASGQSDPPRQQRLFPEGTCVLSVSRSRRASSLRRRCSGGMTRFTGINTSLKIWPSASTRRSPGWRS